MGGDSWKTTTLGDVVELKRGYDLPTRDRHDGPYPVVSSSGISGYHSEAKVKAPGVVTGRYGTIGEVFYITDDFWPLNTSLYVRDFKGNNPRFISYFLSTINFLAYSDKAAVPGINRNHLHTATVRVPEPKQQQAIACILGSLDDKIELNRRMNQTIEAMSQAIFKSWFVDFDPVHAKAAGQQPLGLAPHVASLFPDTFEDYEISEIGEIPSGWQITSLGTISEKPQYGYTASANDSQVGPQFLRITDINKEDWINWRTVPFCEIEPSEHRKYQIHVGDLLIARMADPGHGVVIEEEIDAVFASYLIRFRLNDSRLDRYLQYWLRSDAYWNLVRAHQAGSTRASLNAQVLAGFQILLPPLILLDAFKKIVEALRRKVVANVRQTNSLSEIRDVLLPKLISGELRIPDAERIIGRCT
ncbi:MAG: restriction endonuclease subunit S [Thermodesulfobacteriota bacterium]